MLGEGASISKRLERLMSEWDITSCRLERWAEVFSIDIQQEPVEELNSYYAR